MKIIPEIKTVDTEFQGKYFSGKKTKRRIPEKWLHISGIFSIVAFSILFVFLLLAGIKYAAMTLVLLIAAPILVGIIAYPRFGIIVLLVAAYFIMWIYKMGIIDFQLGTVMDGLNALLIFSFFLHQKFRPDWSILKTPIAKILLIWIGYTLLQVANPSAESMLAWVYTIRTIGVISLSYFIFSYFITDLSYLRKILNIWMFLSFLGALNAFKQQHFGFFAFEESDFNNPLVQALLFINGEWRKFSIFSDPVAFSYNMVISSLYCFSIIVSPNPLKKKVLHGLLCGFFLMTMLYSATRGAYVLIPAAIILYVVMNMNRQVLILGAFSGLFFLALINIPTSNVTLYRFQSAFKPSDDASFNARAINQAKLQPYVRTHPFGGGLGAMGTWGYRFSPYSFLASIPPDSGYVRVAGELGWVGLILFCSLFFITLRQGIINYFSIKDPELKSYCLAMTLIVYALNVGSFPQEALVQYPTNIFFYLFLAIINITLKLDKEKQAKENNSLIQ